MAENIKEMELEYECYHFRFRRLGKSAGEEDAKEKALKIADKIES